MSADEKALRAIRRYEEIATERVNFESHWQEVADHVLGRRDFTVHRTPGEKRRTLIFDTTPLHAHGVLTAGLHSLLSNPASQFFHFKPDDDKLLQVDSVRFWIEFVETHIRNILASPKRGYQTSQGEVYADLTGFGTGGMFIEERPGMGALFAAIPLMELFLGEDAYGKVDSVFRKFELSARNANEIWGEDAGPKVKHLLGQNKPEQKVNFLHAVQPASEKLPTKLRFTNTSMPIESLFVALDDKQTISENGYFEMPYITPRWEKDTGEAYGRGPGMNALPDAKMLNAMSETLIRAAQKATDPPMMVDDDGVIFPVRLQPGGLTKVRGDSLRENAIRPLPVDARGIGIGDAIIRQRQQMVQEHFHFELLSMIRDPRMTATQVLEISNNVMRVISPLLGRLQVEDLEPVIDRTFAIEWRRGALPSPPSELSGAKIKVVYESPVARAQREGEVQAILTTLAEAQQFASTTPDILHNLDFDQAIRKIAEFRGVPASVIRSMRDVMTRREAEDAAVEEEEQKQLMLQAGTVGAKLLPALAKSGLTGGAEAPAA